MQRVLTARPSLAAELHPHVPFGWKLTTWADPATMDTVVQLTRTAGPPEWRGARLLHRVSRQEIATDYQQAVVTVYAWMREVTETAAVDWTEEVLLTEAAKGVDVASSDSVTRLAHRVHAPVTPEPVPGACRIDLDEE